MALHESAEMYLETIYILTRSSQSVRSVDVAEHMGYSKPSVSRAVGLLKKGGYLLVDREGYLTLTPEGQARAQKTYERHTVLSRVFKLLGVPEEIAAEIEKRIKAWSQVQDFLEEEE